jgi:hypothetical protein
MSNCDSPLLLIVAYRLIMIASDLCLWAGIAQSVQPLATVWIVRGSNSGDDEFYLHPSRRTVGPISPLV